MANEATTIEEQIKKLTERGMNFDNKDKAKEQLLHIGYYRLGFYWYHFEKNPNENPRTHQFKEGTNFSEVMDLYYLDCDLRHEISKYIEKIEIDFRTKVIYYSSNNYENHTWYIDEGTYIDDPEKNNHIKRLKKEAIKLENKKITLENKKNTEEFLAAWKVLEFLSFNTIFNIYKNLADTKLKNQIANQYIKILNEKKSSEEILCEKKSSEEILCEKMELIINLRNACFHNSVLYDHKIFTNNNTNQNRCLNIGQYIKDMGYFLTEEDNEQLSKNVESILDKYRNENKIYIINIINSQIYCGC